MKGLRPRIKNVNFILKTVPSVCVCVWAPSRGFKEGSDMIRLGFCVENGLRQL